MKTVLKTTPEGDLIAKGKVKTFFVIQHPLGNGKYKYHSAKRKCSLCFHTGITIYEIKGDTIYYS